MDTGKCFDDGALVENITNRLLYLITTFKIGFGGAVEGCMTCWITLIVLAVGRDELAWLGEKSAITASSCHVI